MPDIIQNTLANLRGNTNPVLSAVALGWKHPGGVADDLLPFVSVPLRGGTLMRFDRTSFTVTREMLMRARASRVLQQRFGLEPFTYALDQYGLEGLVAVEDFEEAMRSGVDNSLRTATQGVMDMFMLARERHAASILTTAANYASSHSLALTGNDRWGKAQYREAASQPYEDLNDAIEQVRLGTAMQANVLVMGAKVWAALRRHPNMTSQISDNRDKALSLQDISTITGIEKVLVARAAYRNPGDAQDADLRDVWGSSVVVAYVAPPGMRDARMPSFGYTMRLQGYPVVENGYYDPKVRSWCLPTFDEWHMSIFTKTAGYLITNAV